MGNYRRRRVHLKAHDRGDNRHAKDVRWLRKVAHTGRLRAKQRTVLPSMIRRPNRASTAHIYDVP